MCVFFYIFAFNSMLLFNEPLTCGTDFCYQGVYVNVKKSKVYVYTHLCVGKENKIMFGQ